jgi:photosystem II stability/assembly factor-like uncharacterized protein
VLLLLATTVSAAEIEWTQLREPGCGGWIVGFIVSPHDSNRVLVSGDMLGVGLSTDRGDSWQSTYGFKSYEMADFSWHLTDSNTVWVGSMSGPYLSKDGGKTWESRRSGMPSPVDNGYTVPIEKVLFDPNNAEHLIAVGGNSRQWQSRGPARMGAIWESTDAGNSWKQLTTVTANGSKTDARIEEGRNITGAAFAAKSSTKLYAIAGGNAAISEDAGKTWTVSCSGLQGGTANRLATHPTDSNIAWLCTLTHERKGTNERAPGGIYKTTDGGKTWSRISNGLPQLNDKQPQFTSKYPSLTVCAKNPDVMYTSEDNWRSGGIFKTEDGGQNWKRVCNRAQVGQKSATDAGAPFAAETAFFSGICMTYAACDPNDPNRAYLMGSEYILRTLDGGKTWNDATAKKLEDGAWAGRGYSGLCSVNFRFDPFRKDHWIVSAMDAGKCWETKDAGVSWVFRGHKPWPWGGGNDACFTRSETIYATTGQFGSHGSVIRTHDGKNWETIAGKEHGLPAFEGQGTATAIYAYPDEPKMVWVVFAGKLFHSTDGGDRWEQLDLGKNDIGHIAGDPTKPTRFYVSSGRAVYLTEDGRNFTSLRGPRCGGRMVVDPKGRLYLAAYRGERPGVWRYVRQPARPEQGRRDQADANRGDSNTDSERASGWTRLTTRWEISNVAVDPANLERLALCENDDPWREHCHSRGVWVSADGGASWSSANKGNPCMRGWAIAFDPFDGERLVVGTQGLGYFTARWPKDFKPEGVERYTHTAEDTAFAEKESVK